MEAMEEVGTEAMASSSKGMDSNRMGSSKGMEGMEGMGSSSKGTVGMDNSKGMGSNKGMEVEVEAMVPHQAFTLAVTLTLTQSL